MNKTRLLRLGIVALSFLLADILASGCGGGEGCNNQSGGSSGDVSPRPPGGILVADQGNNRVARINDMSGANWSTIAAVSTARVRPFDVTTDSLGRIYWVDLGVVNRINDLSGAGLVRFGGKGSGVGEFNQPSGIAVDSSFRIYVSDRDNRRVVRIDGMDGANWVTLTGHGADNLGEATHVTLDTAGRLYISDAVNNRVVRTDDITGAGWTSFGRHGQERNQFDRPEGVWVDPDSGIYIVDRDNNRIVKIDDMTGSGWRTYGTHGSGVGQFGAPYRICGDGRGHILVADTANSRVVRINDMSGAGWTSLGTPGEGIRQFRDLESVCVSRATGAPVILMGDGALQRLVRIDDITGSGWTTYSGLTTLASPSAISAYYSDLYVADTANDRIVLIPEHGIPVSFGTSGSGAGQFHGPKGIYVDTTAGNRIYVADSGNNRIVRIDNMAGDGWVTVGTFGRGSLQFSDPSSVFVIGHEGIYVADRLNSRIVRMSGMRGENFTVYGGRGSAVGQFVEPEGVANGVAAGIKAHGIFIADTGNHRLVSVEDMAGTGWQTLSLPGTGTDTTIPFHPTSVYPGPTSNTLYVADPPNGRIIQVTNFRQGLFTRYGYSGAVAGAFDRPHTVIGP